MALLKAPLSRQERQALALRRAGMTNSEIGDEMGITNSHVACVLTHARRKGAVFPPAKRGPSQAVPIERLAQIRRSLRASGRDWGVYSLIAERVGMTTNAVRVRLWKHDHKQQGANR